MPPKRSKVGRTPVTGACVGRIVLLLGAAAAIATLVLLSIFVHEVVVFAKEAPSMLGGAIMDYVEKEAPEILDAYVEEKLMPGLQEEMLGWMFGPGAAGDTGADARHDEVVPHPAKRRGRRHAPVPQCPVSDASLCAKFRDTCSAFRTCRSTRDRTACVGFVRTLNVACAANTCSSYYDRSLCDTVNTACSMRIRCMFNTTACSAMESDLAGLCSLV